MKVTFKLKPEDPAYPFMHGKSPTAKEFNKRQADIWKAGHFQKFDFEQVATILLEMFVDDYDKRHASKARKGAKKRPKSDAGIKVRESDGAGVPDPIAN